MIDTTTVNYALSKIKDAAPYIEKASQEYVRYMVFSAITSAIGWLLVVAMFAGTGFLVFAKWPKDAYNKKSRTEGCVIISLILWGIALLLSIVLACSIWEVVMALNFPEVYTVQKIVETAAGSK